MVSATESLAQLESTERRSIGVYGNATSARAEMTVTARLSRVSGTYPNALALIAPSRRMTFREVHTEANLLARRLEAEFEVGSESLVALLVERSCAMVVGILGIVYAHAAYVPIDLQLPLQRKVEILEDARPQVVLATAETIALLPSSFHHRACLVGDDREALPEESNLCALPAPISASVCASVEGSLPAPCRLPSSSTSSSSPTDEVPHISPLLYVLYTSGSTGKPKGVMVEHASLVHRIDWLQAAHPLASGRDSVLLKTSAGFGISEWEIFWPLLSGAVMVLASPDGHKDSSYLCDLIRANSVSVLFFVPSMLNALLKEAEEAPAMPSIRYVFCCGEPLKPEICRRLHAPLSGIRARMCNLYGPTEADMTYWYVPDAGTTELVQLGHVPIGHPIEDCDVLLVDPSNESELLPVEGERVGEICFDSVGTTRGYLGMGDLTRKVVLPSSSGRGRRVFRTGDLGRWGAHGLEYIGRKDCQIKLRGLRIECVPRDPIHFASFCSRCPRCSLCLCAPTHPVHCKGLGACVARAPAPLAPHTQPGRDPVVAWSFAPRQTRRDRARDAPLRGHLRGLCDARWRQQRESAARRLRRTTHVTHGSDQERAAPGIAGVHGAVGHRAAGAAATQYQRQGGQEGACGARAAAAWLGQRHECRPIAGAKHAHGAQNRCDMADDTTAEPAV